MNLPPIPPISSNSARVRRRLVDAFIAGVLLLFVLDTLPCTPGRVRDVLAPLLNVTGLWQGTWSLFAPIPDARNHRLRADLFYADGSHRVWNSPDWRSQTPWQRFRSHRESEFIENVWDEENSAAWQGFAEFLARQHSGAAATDERPVRVELSVRWGDVPPPDDGPSRPASQPMPLDRERTFFTLLFQSGEHHE